MLLQGDTDGQVQHLAAGGCSRPCTQPQFQTMARCLTWQSPGLPQRAAALGPPCRAASPKAAACACCGLREEVHTRQVSCRVTVAKIKSNCKLPQQQSGACKGCFKFTPGSPGPLTDGARLRPSSQRVPALQPRLILTVALAAAAAAIRAATAACVPAVLGVGQRKVQPCHIAQVNNACRHHKRQTK